MHSAFMHSYNTYISVRAHDYSPLPYGIKSLWLTANSFSMSVSSATVAGLAFVLSGLSLLSSFVGSPSIGGHGVSSVGLGVGGVEVEVEFVQPATTNLRGSPTTAACPDVLFGLEGWRLQLALLVIEPSAAVLAYVAGFLAVYGAGC